jgi:23S rRNA pseudouridine1911/1915/1917 synthase
MIENDEFVQNEAGVRLDAALFSRYPSSTRAFCREACAAGDVLVDGRPAIKGMKLRGGETVVVKMLAEECDNRVAPDRSVPVETVFEDEAMLAFDKPSGLPVQPLSRV